jgi:hypothetical protein
LETPYSHYMERKTEYYFPQCWAGIRILVGKN